MNLIYCCFVVLIVFFRALYSNEGVPTPVGNLIIFAGISGSGKSSLAREVAKRSNAICFLEPEEEGWPDFVQEKQFYGEFSSLMTIRSIRVHSLWKAWEAKEQGNLVFVDTYYDKIHSYYLSKPGMEWLIDPKDPYFMIAEEVCRLDTNILPNADAIILLDIGYEDWIKMLTMRGRGKDFISGFQESYNLAKQYLFDAIQTLSREKNIPVIIFEQKFGDFDEQVNLLTELLKKEEIFSKKNN